MRILIMSKMSRKHSMWQIVSRHIAEIAANGGQVPKTLGLIAP